MSSKARGLLEAAEASRTKAKTADLYERSVREVIAYALVEIAESLRELHYNPTDNTLGSLSGARWKEWRESLQE